MPSQSKSLMSKLSNTKTRTFVLFFGALLLGGIVIAFGNRGSTEGDPLAKQGSIAASAPSQIKATPGSIVSTEYKKLQTAENQRRAEQASKASTSAIPTITGSISDLSVDQRDKDNLDAALQTGGLEKNSRLQFGDTPETGFAGPFGKSSAEREREKQESRVAEERKRIDKIRSDKEQALLQQQAREQEARLASQEQKAYQDELKLLTGQMRKYANAVYDEWSKFPKQQFVQGALATRSSTKDGSGTIENTLSRSASRKKIAELSDGSRTTTSAGKKSVKPRQIIKAGTILFGVLETAVNTDEPGPVLATVVSGRYNGSRLLGSLKHDTQQEGVTITFNQMNIPKRLHTLSISVVAIDPDTARTALASDVNHHYLLRYGTLFASSFITGYAQAIQQQGSTTTVSPLTGATTTTYPPLDNRQIFLSALGQVGTQWGNATKSYFNTPYTVTVNQGTGVGLLFMTDAELTEEG